jgi:hypothetical protein
MRRTPRPGIALVVFVAYVLVVTVVWAVNGIDHEIVQDTTGNLVGALVVPIGLGALFLAAAATWLGWWRPAIVDEHRSEIPRWALVVPVLILAGALLGLSAVCESRPPAPSGPP